MASTVSTVENLLKTQVQLDNVNAQRFQGSWDCCRQLLLRQQKNNHPSITILYTGHGVNTVREMTFLATYFGMYEGIRGQLVQWEHTFHPYQQQQHHHHQSTTIRRQDTAVHRSSAWIIPMAGGISGAIAWIVRYGNRKTVLVIWIYAD